MRNINEVQMTTTMTSTKYITEYKYSIMNSVFESDFRRMVKQYGARKVERVGFGKYNYIIVTQPMTVRRNGR